MKKESFQDGKRRCTILRHLRGVQLSVYEYAARVTAKNPDRELFATNATIGEETGYKSRSIGKAKRGLAEAGWLKALGGNRGSGQDGRFEPNRYVVIGHDEWAKAHPGKCLGQGDRGTSDPQRPEAAADGERGVTKGTDRQRSDDTDRSGPNIPQSLKELDPILKGKPSPSAKVTSEGSSSEEKEKRQAKSDQRYPAVLQFYCSEFQRRHSGTQAPLGSSDRKALKGLLSQQSKASAETIIGWLGNAFASTTQYPLVRGWRLREFVCHFSKYVGGPLHRGEEKVEFIEDSGCPHLADVRPKSRFGRGGPVTIERKSHSRDPY